MFARLGTLAARFRWYIVAAWVVVAVVLTLVAPNIDTVAVNDQRAFLPAHTASLDAIDTVRKYFPSKLSPSSAVLVLDAGPGKKVTDSPAWAQLSDIATWLSSPGRPAVVDRILSPTSADAQTARALISKNGQVALAVVSFNRVGTEDPTRAALKAITDRMDKITGAKTYVTGDAAIIAAVDEAARQSLDSTTWITVVLVILILLLVYRSPVSPVVPLLTITLAYLISRAIIAFLGNGTITISGYTNIFLLVVLFGAGTDYCLFLISRFREEMADRHVAGPAVRETVRRVGETIASSAGTVIVGLSTMALARLGFYNTTGPSVAIGVAIALAAGLTFTPAMLSILGDHTFWPRKARHMSEGRFWHSWAGVVTGHPVFAIMGTLIVLVPLAIYGQGQARDFDLLGDLPDSVPAHQGFHVLADTLGPGTMQPLTVVVTDPNGFDTAAGLAKLDAIGKELAAVKDVADVTSFTTNLAGNKTLSVSKQLADQVAGLQKGIAQLKAGQTAGTADPAKLQQAATGLQSIFSYVQQLGGEYPDVAQTASYRQTMGALASIQQIAIPLQSTPATTTPTPSEVPAPGARQPSAIPPSVQAQLENALGELLAGLTGLQHAFSTRPDAQMLPKSYLASNKGLRDLTTGSLADSGRAARFQVILGVGPYDPAALDAMQNLRNVAGRYGGVAEGSSAIVADLRTASNGDMTRSIILVLAGIFIVLVILLRAVVAPIYLLLTILLSYGATLGIVRLVFGDLLGAPGVTWWVLTFMFVMLVALGMDYNIFLMGRVKEEVAKTGTREGTRTAVARTGGIITSAGLIMAGTFAAMMSAQILGLRQLGFAVAVGVLLDTFVVRTSLVPAIVVLLGRWSWWPRRGPAAPKVTDPGESSEITPSRGAAAASGLGEEPPL